ncbi:Chitinase 1 [Wickerhamiella sorbophila]|uniref:chitinase n=1 Tax=Wickerhamiella sorbophila TaxID=45607 RepID=A0A2T0FGP0_9ASCO|nr:Chitinase 1 [Wickerhamiella sorbophila]PRT54156.1 Chitinase 1 [Wickerhamiella sorbophila]
MTMLTTTLLASFFASLPLAAAFSDSANNNVAIYWGQNSLGQDGSQQNLAYYCNDDASDVVLVSFLNQFFAEGGLPSINLGPSCGGTTFAGTNLLSCPDVGKDIATCQGKGKKILLSLGGASGAYGFTSADQAKDFANTLWNLFAGGSSDTRPFGDVKVDGFDLDIEGGSNQYYNDFVDQMRQNYASDASKKYYISGAPQCPIPDQMLNPAMTTSDFDMYFVQFYNNYCGLQSYGTDNFNFAAWDNFAKTQSSNPNAKVYLGVPGGPTAAGSGYVDADQVIKIANDLQSKYSSFGGVSIWDASQAWANHDFADVVKAGLESSQADPQPSLALSTTDQNKNVVPSTSAQAPASSSAPASANGPASSSAPASANGPASSSAPASANGPAASSTPASANSPAASSTPAPADPTVTVRPTVTLTKFFPLASCGCVANN